MTPETRILKPLTAAEVQRGWVEYHCPRHGGLVAMAPGNHVTCRCGMRTKELRHGRTLSETTGKPTGARAITLNKLGHPNIHACADCGEDFGGKTILKWHRRGREPNKVCMTPVEMIAKGWKKDEKGRWRLAIKESYTKRVPVDAGKPDLPEIRASEAALG